jgi:hypothetical protein
MKLARTSKRVAKEASRVLRSRTEKKIDKSVAGSDLRQRRKNKK